MKYVVFENKGEIDIRMIRTFGVSVKEGENPIGFFGTGLKYAIAIILREGCELTILSGLKSVNFHKKEVELRGKTVDIVTMNGLEDELSFTTHLGSTWEPWQAFRELYCNCKDEGGSVYETDNFPEPKEGFTSIVVSGKKMTDIYYEKNEIVLSLPSAKKYETSMLEIYDAPSKHLYYRGVRVWSFDQICQFTYNLLAPQVLTEDRTLRNVAVALDYIHYGVAQVPDRAFCRKIILASNHVYEHKFNFYNLRFTTMISNEFMDVVAEEYRINSEEANQSAINFYVSKEEKTIFRASPMTLDNVQRMQVDRAKKVVGLLLGKDVIDKYPIEYVETLGKTRMAYACFDTNKVVIAKGCFQRGTKFLASTFLEEFVHLETRHGDLTRELQTYLFDFICSMTENHILKEPI